MNRLSSTNGNILPNKRMRKRRDPHKFCERDKEYVIPALSINHPLGYKNNILKKFILSTRL